MSYVTAIVLAAGKGLRFSRSNSSTVRSGTKPLIKVNSKPIIIYCLDTLSRHPGIRDIVVVVNTLNEGEIISRIRQYCIGKIRQVVKGGRRRQDSVINGLNAMDERTDLVLIHDAVRPFIDKEIVSSVINEAERCGAAIVGVPVKATIKIANRKSQIANRIIVKKTLDRNNLWEIQTPQVFKKNLILEAYKKFPDTEVTDDASLVERWGAEVKIVKGSYSNIKITTPEDLVIAEAIAKNRLLTVTKH